MVDEGIQTGSCDSRDTNRQQGSSELSAGEQGAYSVDERDGGRGVDVETSKRKQSFTCLGIQGSRQRS